jgi:nucleoside phosphorylase
MDMPERIAIIAAMEREVLPLVRYWQSVPVDGLRAWRSGDLLVVCGGIGLAPARKAAEAVVRAFGPEVLISVGFAGSLDHGCRVPEVLVPAKVIDARSGKEYRAANPTTESTLLSVESIADSASKQELARLYGARAVDMEAAAVAQVACKHGLEFRVVKAISEDVDFPLPPLGRFLSESGEFRTRSFVSHLAVRPRLWTPVWNLRRNTTLAAAALSAALCSLQGGGAAAGDLAQPCKGAG